MVMIARIAESEAAAALTTVGETSVAAKDSSTIIVNIAPNRGGKKRALSSPSDGREVKKRMRADTRFNIDLSDCDIAVQ